MRFFTVHGCIPPVCIQEDFITKKNSVNWFFYVRNVGYNERTTL